MGVNAAAISGSHRVAADRVGDGSGRTHRPYLPSAAFVASVRCALGFPLSLGCQCVRKLDVEE